MLNLYIVEIINLLLVNGKSIFQYYNTIIWKQEFKINHLRVQLSTVTEAKHILSPLFSHRTETINCSRPVYPQRQPLTLRYNSGDFPSHALLEGAHIYSYIIPSTSIQSSLK